MAESEDKKKNINIRNIKSSYIIKEVFSILYEKHRLNMIIYNNDLQRILLVDIEYYKKMWKI